MGEKQSYMFITPPNLNKIAENWGEGEGMEEAEER